MTQTTIVAARYHEVKAQEDMFMAPVIIPSGIPIINPNPTRNEGAMATSGLLAKEKSTINESIPKKSKGLIKNVINRTGTGKIILPIAGTMTK